MSQEIPSEPADSLAEAQAIIEQQKQDIRELQRHLESNRQLDSLRDTYSLIASTKTIADPITHHLLLDMIVQTAAAVLEAKAASLFIIDQETQELVFEVATGPKAVEVAQYRVPLGHGIAGLVALTGQPMAISDAANNPLHASDISKSVEYVPNSILCAPLFYQDQIIGVLELLDKESGKPFDGRDMGLIGIFANQAAIAIELSHTHYYLVKLFNDLFQTTNQRMQYPREQMLQSARSFQKLLERDTTVKQALEYATLLQEIIWLGEEERDLCRLILQGFVQYLHARSAYRGK